VCSVDGDIMGTRSHPLRHASTAIATLALSLLATACGRNRAPALVQPVGETHTTASSTGGARPQGQDSPSEPVGVVLTEQVRRACDLPEPSLETPQFDFDAAKLRPRGDDVLEGLATCVTRNRLGDATIRIVGHTDPRGTDEYNEQLGRYRALAARQHLVDLGVPSNRLVVESRGERNARGTDPESWARDRRIEINVGGPRVPLGSEERR
jgi:outer membrane protein OmpA-like peptidoglycan-associated protein